MQLCPLVETIGKLYEVKTSTIDSILESVGAPEYIDFMSIDIEGHEVEALSGIDFTKYSFGFICVEHNYDKAKSRKIREMMVQNGYREVLSEISQYDSYFAQECIT